jgi:hypothetical protein
MAMNVEDFCTAASVLSLDGRNDIRGCEAGVVIREARRPDPPQAEDAGFVRHAEIAEVADRADDRYHAPAPRSSSVEELTEKVFESEFDLLDEDSEEVLSDQSLQQQRLLSRHPLDVCRRVRSISA